MNHLPQNTIKVSLENLKNEFGSHFTVYKNSGSNLYEIYEEFGNLDTVTVDVQSQELISLHGRTHDNFPYYKTLDEAKEGCAYLNQKLLTNYIANFEKIQKSLRGKWFFLRYNAGLIKNDSKIIDAKKFLEKLNDFKEKSNTPQNNVCHYLPEEFIIYAHYPQKGQKMYVIDPTKLDSTPIEEVTVSQREIYSTSLDSPYDAIFGISFEEDQGKEVPIHYISVENLLSFNNDRFIDGERHYFISKNKALDFLEHTVNEYIDNIQKNAYGLIRKYKQM